MFEFISRMIDKLIILIFKFISCFIEFLFYMFLGLLLLSFIIQFPWIVLGIVVSIAAVIIALVIYDK